MNPTALKNILSNYILNRALVGYIAAFLCIFCTIIYVLYEIEIPIVMRRLLQTAGDTMIILLPYWFLPPRWRWTVIIPLWAIAIFEWVNLLYFRVFTDIMPWSVLFLWNNIDSNVTANILPNMRQADICLLILPLAATLMFRFVSPCKTTAFKLPTRLTAIILAALCMIIPQARLLAFNYKAINRHSESNNSLHEYITRLYLLPDFQRRNEVMELGAIIFTIKATVNHFSTLHKKKRLTEAEIREITAFLAEGSKSASTDSVYARITPKKNVILIIVESLNGWAVNQCVGKDSVDVTPTLSHLIQSDSAFHSLTVRPQHSFGTSSDGQLIINTGLLPLRHDVTAINHADSKYIGLPALLDKQFSFEVISESPAIWNHSRTSKAYGYDKLYAKDSLDSFAGKHPDQGIDGLLFNYALNVIARTQQSFFCEITTLSMHIPFTNDKKAKCDPRIDQLTGISNEYRNYLRMLNYFDHELGLFLERLKAIGRYDDTAIFIASDHDIHILGSEHIESPVCFFAINTGVKGEIKAPVGQIDIFPTILDLAGVPSASGSWRGLGTSMLNPMLSSSVTPDGTVHGNADQSVIERQRKAWDISEKMIIGDYFSHIGCK